MGRAKINSFVSGSFGLALALFSAEATSASQISVVNEAIEICRGTPFSQLSPSDVLVSAGWEKPNDTDIDLLLSAKALLDFQQDPEQILKVLHIYPSRLEFFQNYEEMHVESFEVILAIGQATRTVIAYNDYPSDLGTKGRCLIAATGGIAEEPAARLVRGSDKTTQSRVLTEGHIHQYKTCGSPKSRTDKMSVSIVNDDELWKYAGGKPEADVAIRFEYESRRNCNLDTVALEGRFDGE